MEKKNRKLTIELFGNVQESNVSVIKEKAESLWNDLTAVGFAEK